MPRSRLLSVLGWLHVALGVYVPGRTLWGYYEAWALVRQAVATQMDYFILDVVEIALFGLLSVASGLLILRRHRWAPAAAFIIGGVLLVGAGFTFWDTGRVDWRLIQSTYGNAKFWRITASRILELALILGRILVTMLTLGTIYLPSGRREFPATKPETTSRHLLGGLGLSMVVEGLFKAWMLAMGSIHHDP